MKYFNNCIAALMLCVLGMPKVAAQDGSVLLDKIAAVVGDKFALYSDIEVQSLQTKMQNPNADVAELRCSLIDQVLLQKLLATQAEIDSVLVSEEEVDGEVENRAQYFVQAVGGEEAFEQYYSKSVADFKDEIRIDVRERLLAQRMQGEVLSNIKVTPSDVQKFFNDIPKDSIPYLPTEVEVAQLLLKPRISEAAKIEARQALKDLRDRIVSGKDNFEKLAEIYSEDPGSAVKGGNLGFMERGMLVPAFEAKAFSLQKNEISDIVETEYGYHIIKMLERRGNRINIQHILIKPKINSDDLKLAKLRLDSIRTLIASDSLSFADAVAKYSDDESTKNAGGIVTNPSNNSTYLPLDQLETDVYFAINGLKEGDISQVSETSLNDGGKAYQILLLRRRIEPHRANLKDDYEKLKKFVENQKQAEALNRWLTERAQQTYIFIAPEFAECPNLKKWEN
ncbi:MAG: peptidylprolyl isomerase [Sphingobacteriales bacterium]|nr:peptidylprolyl isomerase [Sphingobacteriales bacterium]